MNNSFTISNNLKTLINNCGGTTAANFYSSKNKKSIQHIVHNALSCKHANMICVAFMIHSYPVFALFPDCKTFINFYIDLKQELKLFYFIFSDEYRLNVCDMEYYVHQYINEENINMKFIYKLIASLQSFINMFSSNNIQWHVYNMTRYEKNNMLKISFHWVDFSKTSIANINVVTIKNFWKNVENKCIKYINDNSLHINDSIFDKFNSTEWALHILQKGIDFSIYNNENYQLFRMPESMKYSNIRSKKKLILGYLTVEEQIFIFLQYNSLPSIIKTHKTITKSKPLPNPKSITVANKHSINTINTISNNKPCNFNYANNKISVKKYWKNLNGSIPLLMNMCISNINNFQWQTYIQNGFVVEISATKGIHKPSLFGNIDLNNIAFNDIQNIEHLLMKYHFKLPITQKFILIDNTFKKKNEINIYIEWCINMQYVCCVKCNASNNMKVLKLKANKNHISKVIIRCFNKHQNKTWTYFP